ncbi:hypothetical protein LXA62_18260, partial [Erwinia amylovora]|uniref:hypothetical protein n=1 Tax=Erwinia amylovora TaxID=552 RepID=UPI0020BF22A2
ADLASLCTAFRACLFNAEFCSVILVAYAHGYDGNQLLADHCLPVVDGVSSGSNALTPRAWGLVRDSGVVSDLLEVRYDAVKAL